MARNFLVELNACSGFALPEHHAIRLFGRAREDRKFISNSLDKNNIKYNLWKAISNNYTSKLMDNWEGDFNFIGYYSRTIKGVDTLAKHHSIRLLVQSG